jgi:hypothetical protein
VERNFGQSFGAINLVYAKLFRLLLVWEVGMERYEIEELGTMQTTRVVDEAPYL